MRRQLNSLLSTLRTEQLEILTTLVKETLDMECNKSNVSTTKIFTAADLWNIQRQGKSRLPRRIFA